MDPLCPISSLNYLLKPETIVGLCYKILLLQECGLSHSCVPLPKCIAPNCWDHVLITPCLSCHSVTVQPPYVWRKVQLSCIYTPRHEAIQNKWRRGTPKTQISARELTIPTKGFCVFPQSVHKKARECKTIRSQSFHIPSNSVFTNHPITWC
jgi:hypothetical protein